MLVQFAYLRLESDTFPFGYEASQPTVFYFKQNRDISITPTFFQSTLLLSHLINQYSQDQAYKTEKFKSLTKLLGSKNSPTKG